MSIALIDHEKIKTTLPKAKELRPFFEKILTISKVDSLSNRRLAYSILGNNDGAIKKLFSIIGPKILNRSGGYVRIMKYGFRSGDKAPMSLIEFVDQISDASSALNESRVVNKAKIKSQLSSDSSPNNEDNSKLKVSK